MRLNSGRLIYLRTGKVDMSKASDRIEYIEKVGMASRGRAELINYLSTGKGTARQVILAKCYDCCGYYADGRVDCKLETCPLYPYMPYSSKPAPKRAVSEEARERSRKNMARLHSKNAV